MAKKKPGIRFDIQLDQRALDYFKNHAPKQLKDARKNVVKAAGMVWADEAKDITTNENHVVTGLYVNSIGYVTGSPASEADTIHELQEQPEQTALRIGSSVEYAAYLEKKYAIMARALDVSEERIQTVANEQVRRTLRL